MTSAWLGVACSESEIEQYTVAKGSEPIAQSRSDTMPQPLEPGADADDTIDTTGPAADRDSIADAAWVVPDGWLMAAQEKPMRVATYLADDVDGPVEVAITRFAGDVGGLLANVNRWRGQLDMEPVGESELSDLLTSFESPGFSGHLLHLRGPNEHMLAASIYEPSEDRTWFVRVVESKTVIERIKPEVFSFARSFGTADEERR